MVESAGEIQATISADPTGAKRGVKTAQRTFKDFVRGLKRLSGTIGITLSVAFAVRKFTNFIKLSIQITREFELQRAALTAIIQGQERFLDLAGQQIPVEKARIQALEEQERLFNRITEGGLRPILSTSKEFAGIMTALLPTFRQFGVSLEDSADLMVKMADAATLTSIPLDEMVNQSRQILSSNISNETKLAKIVGLNNEIVNQAKVQGKLGLILSARFGILADNIDLVQNTLAAATIELKNQVELQIDKQFKGARDAVRDMLLELTRLVQSDAFGKLLNFGSVLVVKFTKFVELFAEATRLAGGTATTELTQILSADQEKGLGVVRAIRKEIKEINEELSKVDDSSSFVDKMINTAVSGVANLSRGFAFLRGGVTGTQKALIKTDEVINQLAKRGRLKFLEGLLEVSVSDIARAEEFVATMDKIKDIEKKLVIAVDEGNQKAIRQYKADIAALKKDQEALEKTVVADTQRIDPQVIQFALTNITRTTSALDAQAKILATIRSLELQRSGISKEIADNIGKMEAAAKGFHLRQIQLVQAESVLEKQTANLLSDTTRLAKQLPSIVFAVSDLQVKLVKERDILNEQLEAVDKMADLTDKQKDAKREKIALEIKDLRIVERGNELGQKLVKQEIEKFRALDGAAQRLHEIGLLRETEAPATATVLALIDKMKTADKIRVLSLQAQNVKVREQIGLLQQANRVTQLQNKQFLETEMLLIRQQSSLERSQAVGVDRQLLEINLEMARVGQRIVQLREQQRVEAGSEEAILIKIVILERQIVEENEKLVAAEEKLKIAREGGLENAIEAAGQKQKETQASVEKINLEREGLLLEQESLRNGEQQLTNEIAINEELLKQLEIQEKITPAQELGKDVGQRFRSTVESGIQEAIDGDFDFRQLGKQFATDMLQAGLKPFLEQFQQSMSMLFQKLAGQFGSMLGSAVISVVGLLGTMAFTKSSATGTPTGAGLGKAFEERSEPFRGVIAGRKSIPVAQIRNALSSALMNTNSILRQIASNTARSAENVSVAGTDESDQVLVATAAG